MKIKEKTLVIIFLIFSFSLCYSQEILKSPEEDFFDYLVLTGKADKNYLNYRTLSDSTFQINDYYFINKESFDKKHELIKNIKFKLYSPELYNSFNSASPYGQNDYSLWQGKGYNANFSTGFRFELYGLEISFRPNISFSQNLSYAYTIPNYSGDLYKDKADTYGYYGLRYIDAPQRFGNKAFFSFDFGDTEFRYTWKTITLGFGTQSIFLGPVSLNPIISSNNAPSYPKFDAGIRKQKILIKGIDFGEIETRLWWGKLTESNYFDNDNANNHNLLSGFSLSYCLPFYNKFTFGFNRTMLSKFSDISSYTLFGVLIPGLGTEGGSDKSDGRASVTFDCLFQNIGLNIYGEWARNDFSPGIEYYLKYPFHTTAWTLGLKKNLFSKQKLAGCLILEITNAECSHDYDFILSENGATFYGHNIITQGYTNKGQYLGAGIGTGGNSQYIGLKFFYSKGFLTVFIQRQNPDLDYTYWLDAKKTPHAEYVPGKGTYWPVESNIRANMNYGINTCYYLKNKFRLSGELVFTDEMNPTNVCDENFKTIHRLNVHTNFCIKYIF
jgi:hypothetical protein